MHMEWGGGGGGNPDSTCAVAVLCRRRGARRFTGKLKKEANLTPEKAGLLYFHLANSRGALGAYPQSPGLVPLDPTRFATLAARACLVRCLLASEHVLAD